MELSTLLLSFLLIFFAEIGDKSQLVIFSLTSKFKTKINEVNNEKNKKEYSKNIWQFSWKIIFGATLAFALLNLLAVVFGGTIMNFIKPDLMHLIVGIIFVLFAILQIANFFVRENNIYNFNKKTDNNNNNENIIENIAKITENENKLQKFTALSLPFLLTFVMIFLAEFGDKTQLITANLSTIYPQFFVWIGSTLALFFTTIIATFCGVFLLNKVVKSKHFLELFSGLLFLYLGMSYLLKAI